MFGSLASASAATSLCFVTACYADSAQRAIPAAASSSSQPAGHILVAREVMLQRENGAAPLAIEQFSDGGLLVVLDTLPSTIIKLGADGGTKWAYENPIKNSRIRMAMPEVTGGVVFCLDRKSGPKNFQQEASIVIKLDATGREIKRLDSGMLDAASAPFYAVSGCLAWGTGYAVIAKEADASGAGGPGAMRYTGAIIRLNPDLSIAWRKSVEIRANPIASSGGPRVLANGDLIFVGMDRLFRLDGNGSMRAEAAVPACKWLRTEKVDDRIRLACSRLDPPTSATILEFDLTLKVINKQALGNEDFGLATVCELPDGRFGLLGNDGTKGPFVQIYSPDGQALSKYKFSHAFPKFSSEGAVVDGLAIGKSSIVAVRDVDQRKINTIVSWLDIE
jgi:hypothetical protein